MSTLILDVLATNHQSADGLVGQVTNLVGDLGGPGAGLAVALENLFPPIPSEVILPLAGFAASRGQISLTSAIGWTTLGSLVGAMVLYLVGAVFGRARLRAVVAWLPLLKLSDLDRAESWFSRHGEKTVLLGRMVPIFRSLISIPAGVERMSFVRFALLTTVGSLVWNSVFVVAGYGLGANWRRMEDYGGIFERVVLAVVAAAVVAFVALRVIRRRREAD